MQEKIARTGPRPLWLHLNAGAAMMAAASEGDGMQAAAIAMLQQAMDGVKSYHDSPVKSFRRNMKIAAEVSGSRLLVGKDWCSKNVLILVPSLINGWGIFDIEKDFSFAAFLQKQGLTPLILDWAAPQQNITLDDYILQHLKPLLEKILDDPEVTLKGVIGYCMGGTILAALASAVPELYQHIPKTVMIAPPWDFEYQSADQRMRLQSLAMQTYFMGASAPVDFVQSLFWAVDPLQVFKKFQKFPAVQHPDRFVRVEDWLNEGRSVSTSVIQTCLFDWYRDNKIEKGEWMVGGRTITKDFLNERVMIVYGARDNLVPPASVEPLFSHVPESNLIAVDTGHIGLMASDKATDMWDRVAVFLQ